MNRLVYRLLVLAGFFPQKSKRPTENFTFRPASLYRTREIY